MSKILLEKYLCDNEIIPQDFSEINWKNEHVLLGFVLGLNSKLEKLKSVLFSISQDSQLSPLIRASSLLKVLMIIEETAKKVPAKNKEESTKLILDFEKISEVIDPIKSSLGPFLETFSKQYSKVFHVFCGHFSLNPKISFLGICAIKNKDLIVDDSSIFEFTTEELEKIYSFSHTEKYEMLEILQKKCEIILKKNYKPSETISILVFNTLFKVLNEKQIIEKDIEIIESSLLKYIANFSEKQRERLIETYKKLCKNFKCEIKENIINEYKQNKFKEVKKEEKSEIFIGKELKNKPETECKSVEDKEKPEGSNNGIKFEENKPEKSRKIQNNNKNQNPKTSEIERQTLSRNAIHNFLAKYKSDLVQSKRIDIDEMGNSLKQIIGIDPLLIFNGLNSMAWNVDLNEPKISLFWKLISKCVTKFRFFSNEQRSEINKNIDWIVSQCEGYRY